MSKKTGPYFVLNSSLKLNFAGSVFGPCVNLLYGILEAGRRRCHIANPGQKAIQAVLHPKTSDDLYFVADGTGGHAFSKTLKEHEQNRARWRIIREQLK